MNNLNNRSFLYKIIKNLTIDHPLYPEVTDGRGVAYERVENGEKAEKIY